MAMWKNLMNEIDEPHVLAPTQILPMEMVSYRIDE